MPNGKGSLRRPAAITPAEEAANWERVFAPHGRCRVCKRPLVADGFDAETGCCSVDCALSEQ